MTAFKPTAQQQKAIDAFHTGQDVLISAGAGCGKSSTLALIARSTSKRGLYLAFNRSVAEDAENKLSGTSTLARNTHRLANAWARSDKTGAVVIDKLNNSRRQRYDEMVRNFNVKHFSMGKDEPFALTSKGVARMANETLTRFMQDAEREITPAHLPDLPALHEKPEVRAAVAEQVVPIAQAMWQDILNPNGNKMKVTHDAYLKLWAMAQPRLPYDFILLDEAQDTNPAVFAVFEAQDGAQRVSVGDACQQLFAWNGSLNIMERFDAPVKAHLTQSWRFGKSIEEAANVFLTQLDADIRLEGNPQVPSRVERDAPFDPHLSAATLVRTNAGALREVMDSLDARMKVHLVGGKGPLGALIDAAGDLKAGREANHPDLLGFSSWSEFREYVDEDESALELRTVANLVDQHGAPKIKSALDQCVEREEDAQVTVSTVHKVKGREWDQVRLGPDFDSQRSKKSDKEGAEDAEASRAQLMLYYVAVTRAKTLLDPGPLTPEIKPSLITPVSASQAASAPAPREQVSTAAPSPGPETSVSLDGGVINLRLSPALSESLRTRFNSPGEAAAFIEGAVSGALSMR